MTMADTSSFTCANCGHKYWSFDPCCKNPINPSDLKFKPGDKLLCVNGNGRVLSDNIYTFKRYASGDLSLLQIFENDVAYFTHRFKPTAKKLIGHNDLTEFDDLFYTGDSL